MLAKIIKIHPLKESKTENSYIRVEFILENGEWSKTDVVPAYRNFKNWKALIELFNNGAVVFVEGVHLRKKAEVDADSPVRYTDQRFEILKSKEEKAVQESLL